MEQKQVEFKIDGSEFVARVLKKERKPGVRWSAPRGYVFGVYGEDPSVKFANLAKKYALESVYTRRGEFPEVDRAFDKMNRMIIRVQRQILDAALKTLGVVVTKAEFSQKAGCRCGCSPGFILRGLTPGNWYISVNRKERSEGERPKQSVS